MDTHSKSLNMRFWSRRETLLRPALWSSDDLGLFGCHFRDVDASQLECRRLPTPSAKQGTVVGGDAWALLRGSSHERKTRYMRKILRRAAKYHPTSKFLPLRIGWRFRYAPPDLTVLWPKSGSRLYSDLPVTGYIDYVSISYERHGANRCRPKPGLPRHGFDANFLERLAGIQPKEWWTDPYILCILLCIAQNQYYDDEVAGKSAYRACLLVSSSKNRQDVYLFEATISSALLDQLHDPRICPERPTPPIIINRSVINVDPAKSFGTRVVALLAGYGRLRDDDEGDDDEGDDDEGDDDEGDDGASKDHPSGPDDSSKSDAQKGEDSSRSDT